MALKIRFEEITKGKWKGNLQALSAWFNSRGYFEYDCAGLLEAIRSTRNKQSHPENHFGGGVGLMGVFRHCNNLINDLYEDKEKRRHRREEKSKVKSLLDFLRNNGAVASLLGTRYIIYDAGIFFINNKGAERKYYGFFKKIFELPAENGLKKDNAPILFFFEADEWATEHNGQLIFSNGKSCFLTIDPIFSLLEAKEFKSWKSRYNNSDIYWQTDMAVTDQIDKQWLKEKNAFHFQEDFTL
jgi:hypothetical protein